MTLEGCKTGFASYQGGVKWCEYHKQDYRYCVIERALALLREAPNVPLGIPSAVADYVKRADAFVDAVADEFRITPEELQQRDDQLLLEAEEDARVQQEALGSAADGQREDEARGKAQADEDRGRDEEARGGGPDE